MKSVFIVGNKGNMGRRYAAILRHLGVAVGGCDIGDDIPGEFIMRRMYDGILIASPTQNHLEHIRLYSKFMKPILCEKPLCKSSDELRRFAELNQDAMSRLTMVNQYAVMTDPNAVGDTYYNYWNSGKDGIGWDHINIIGGASGRVVIGTTAPTWACVINGLPLYISLMDTAYLAMVGKWISGAAGNFDYALAAHEKTEKWINECSEKT